MDYLNTTAKPPTILLEYSLWQKFLFCTWKEIKIHRFSSPFHTLNLPTLKDSTFKEIKSLVYKLFVS